MHALCAPQRGGSITHITSGHPRLDDLKRTRAIEDNPAATMAAETKSKRREADEGGQEGRQAVQARPRRYRTHGVARA